MSIDLTIAIPTYNGASRLPQVLERLRSQINTASIRWEILIVDNNSTDHTAQVVRDYQIAGLMNCPLKYCFEPEQGAAFARLAAIRAAQGEWIGFLDDDVLPAEDWVATAFAFGQDHPRLGAYGGQIHGDFQTPPPPNFKRIESFLAIREYGEEQCPYDPDRLVLPPSAALVVRKQAWLESVPLRPRLGGRANGSMIQGDDYEPLLYIHKAGWEIWYNPAMHVAHQIPSRRLEKDYLMSLIRGSSLCICHLRMIKAQAWQRPIVLTKILLGGLRRAFFHLLIYGREIKTDLVAACELEFYLSSCASPFYFLKTQLNWKWAK